MTLFCELSRQQRPAVLSSSNGQAARETPFEHNPSSTAFSNGWAHPRDNDRSRALDLVFGALERAGVDARQRKIVWPDRETAIDRAVNGPHPCGASRAMPRHLIKAGVLGWLRKLYCQDRPPNANSRNSTGSSDPGSTTMSARHEPHKKWPRTRHSQGGSFHGILD